MEQTNVALVGAGPIGIELAVALKQAGVEYVHLDAGQIGHTISWFPPQTRFFSSNERIAIAGVPLQTPDQSKATREQYLAYLRGVVQQFDLPIRTFEPVTNIERHGDELLLTTRPTAGERQIRARRVVLATGGTAAPRRLGVRGEDLPHVSHHLRDPHEYFRRRLLVVGGRNSAVEAALRCHAAGAHVALSYRRGEFDAHHIKYWLYPEITGLMRSGAITAHFQTHVRQIRPDRVLLEGPGGMIEAPADAVLVQIGYVADMSLCRMAGVTLEGESQRPKFNRHTMETNSPGIFIAGTATGGTQDRYRVFIENCHIHVARIVAALTGNPPPRDAAGFEQPES